MGPRLMCLVQAAALGMWLHATPREAIGWVWLWGAVSFVAYLWTLQRATDEDTPWLLAAATLMIAIAVPAAPSLSDDIYRFVWDARVWGSGHNPFELRPSEWVAKDGVDGLPWRDDGLYEVLSSRAFFASYPPFVHAVLWCVGHLPTTSVWAQMMALKATSAAFLLATGAALWRTAPLWSVPRRQVLWFLLNPLVIVEVVGNAHWEAPMACFVVLMLASLRRAQPAAAGLWWGLAASVKLVPLVAGPWIWKRLGWWRGLGAGALAALVLAMSYAAVLPTRALLDNYLIGLRRFFDTFHFNASVAYALIWPLHGWTGDHHVDEVGRALAVGVFAGICWMAWRWPRGRMARGLLASWVLFLCGSLVVHPWYLVGPLAVSCLVKTRAIVAWTVLVQVTYLAYARTPYEESLWLIGAEYALLSGYVLWEARRD